MGDVLSRLAMGMTRAGGRTGATAATSLPVSVLGPLCNAASWASLEGFRLARVVGERLQRGKAFRLCAGLAFTFQVRTALLLGCPDTPRSVTLDEGRAHWRQTALLQISAVHSGIRLAVESGDELAEAWARTTGRPSAMLPWLAAVAQVLSLMISSGGEMLEILQPHALSVMLAPHFTSLRLQRCTALAACYAARTWLPALPSTSACSPAKQHCRGALHWRMQ